MNVADYVKAAIYPSLALGVLSLVPLLPPWWFPAISAGYWESHAIYMWPLLLLGAFAAGWASTSLLARRAGRGGERISSARRALIGLLTGVLGTVLGTVTMTAVLLSVKHLLPDFPTGGENPFYWLAMFSTAYAMSYIIPAVLGGLLAGAWFRKRLAADDDAA